MTTKDFFTHLRDGEEYYNCLMTREVFMTLPLDQRNHISISEVRQKNIAFVEDETHKTLVKDLSKAKSKLIEYEFNKNHNIK
jgi:hypothetical protein